MSRTAVYRTHAEFSVRIKYTFFPFCPGATDGPGGPKLEPDEPAHVEVDACYVLVDDKAIAFTPTKKQLDAYHEEITEWLKL